MAGKLWRMTSRCAETCSIWRPDLSVTWSMLWKDPRHFTFFYHLYLHDFFLLINLKPGSFIGLIYLIFNRWKFVRYLCWNQFKINRWNSVILVCAFRFIQIKKYKCKTINYDLVIGDNSSKKKEIGGKYCRPQNIPGYTPFQIKGNYKWNLFCV